MLSRGEVRASLTLLAGGGGKVAAGRALATRAGPVGLLVAGGVLAVTSEELLFEGQRQRDAAAVSEEVAAGNELGLRRRIRQKAAKASASSGTGGLVLPLPGHSPYRTQLDQLSSGDPYYAALLVLHNAFVSNSRNELESSGSPAVESVPPEKFVPNPGGRLGDAVTRQTARAIKEELIKIGFTDIQQEVRFKKGPLGEKDRYADFVARNPSTGQVKIIQIGRTTASGPPVIRERRALDDIIFSPDIARYPGADISFVERGASKLP